MKTKKFLLLFLSFITIIPTMAQSSFSGGTGASDTPYRISSVADLQQLGKDVNDGIDYETKYFELTKDLDLKDVCSAELDTSWTPIGNQSKQFKGNFNGDGHAINHLYINATSSSNQGLFGCVGTRGSISNLGVINCSVTGKDTLGGVCGYNQGTITSCYNTGSVNGTNYVGGICGRNNNGTITSCYNTGSVKGTNNVGGICGRITTSTITTGTIPLVQSPAATTPAA